MFSWAKAVSGVSTLLDPSAKAGMLASSVCSSTSGALVTSLAVVLCSLSGVASGNKPLCSDLVSCWVISVTSVSIGFSGVGEAPASTSLVTSGALEASASACSSLCAASSRALALSLCLAFLLFLVGVTGVGSILGSSAGNMDGSWDTTSFSPGETSLSAGRASFASAGVVASGL